MQSILDFLPWERKIRLVLGGDRRYFNAEAMQTILRISAANGASEMLLTQDGILSTPAASHLIRKYQTDGGIILSARHNPGGPDGDFDIKFTSSNGRPASETVTEAIYALTQKISTYKTTGIAIARSEPLW